MRLHWFALALLASCGSRSEADYGTVGEPSCVERAGTYLETFTKTSGTCGPINPMTATMSGDRAKNDELFDCSGEVVHSPDNCEVTWSNITCSADDGRGVSVANSRIVWDAAGEHGEGTVSYSSKTGGCAGTYRIRYDRL